jgi:hypothetical protein
MSRLRDTLLGRTLQKRRLAHWHRLAALAEKMDLGAIRQLRGEARQVRRAIDRVLNVADTRLILPAEGSNAMRRQVGAEWAWRPHLWRFAIRPYGFAALASPCALDDETRLHHDCQDSEVTARQIRNTRADDLCPFGLRLDVFRFDGTYLSLVVNLPDSATHDLRLRHLLRVDATIDSERPITLLVRLNVKHGPNTEQLVLEFPNGTLEKAVEFDLAYSNISEKRIERAWIEIFFQAPQMNQITLRDVTISRRQRAEL